MDTGKTASQDFVIHVGLMISATSFFAGAVPRKNTYAWTRVDDLVEMADEPDYEQRERIDALNMVADLSHSNNVCSSSRIV